MVLGGVPMKWFEESQKHYLDLLMEHLIINKQCSSLLRRIQALENSSSSSNESVCNKFKRQSDGTILAVLNKQEIQALIKFCHPDKHKGDVVANKITSKLLDMREACGDQPGIGKSGV